MPAQPETITAYQAVASATLKATQVGRLRGVWLRHTGTEGTAIFKDGGSSGTVILTINTPAAEGGAYHTIPGDGISFGTDLYVALTNVDGVTAYCGLDTAL